MLRPTLAEFAAQPPDISDDLDAIKWLADGTRPDAAPWRLFCTATFTVTQVSQAPKPGYRMGSLEGVLYAAGVSDAGTMLWLNHGIRTGSSKVSKSYPGFLLRC